MNKKLTKEINPLNSSTEEQKTVVNSSFYQSLLEIGFIGCGKGTEDLSANYKSYLYTDFTRKNDHS